MYNVHCTMYILGVADHKLYVTSAGIRQYKQKLQESAVNQIIQTETPRKCSQSDNKNRNSTKVQPIRHYKQKFHEITANQIIQTETPRKCSQSDNTNRNSTKVQSIR